MTSALEAARIEFRVLIGELTSVVKEKDLAPTDLLVRMREILNRKQTFANEQLRACELCIKQKERKFLPILKTPGSSVPTHASEELKFSEQKYVELLINQDEYNKNRESIGVGLGLLDAIEQSSTEDAEN